MRRISTLVIVAALVGLGVWAYFYAQSRGATPRYRTVRVERGPLTAAVSSTGNLNAVILVQVGSQVSGQIKDLYADFNTIVKKNQVIAKIDPEIFDAKVVQAKADVDSAAATVTNQVAQVEKGKADVENARAALAEAKANTAKAQVAVVDSKRDLERKKELFGRELIARSDLDSAEATYDSNVALLEAGRAKEQSLAAAIQSAIAQLRVLEAQLQAARAQVEQRKALLTQAQADLEHTTIRAPVNGVVVSRQVDVGQTVAASLQAPVLFTIAEDLTKMQVEVSVDEADIGRVRLDDRTTFTVDAFPGQTFTGTVTQIRKAALVVQNVVTYTVVVSVDNPGGKLLPGMTANVKMITAEKPNVLKVANAALRFRPAGTDATPGAGMAAPAAGGGGQGERGGAGGANRGEQMKERLTKALGLSKEQQQKLDAIFADTRQQMQALPEQDRAAKGPRIREAARVRIREMLTPAQRAKYDEMSPGENRGGGDRLVSPSAPGRVYVVDGEKLKPVSLTLGISDGTFTEVLRGELADGQEVVIGTTGKQGGGTSGSSPRLRL